MHTGTQKDCSQDLDSPKSQNQLKMGCGLSQFSQNTGEVQAYVASAANSTKGELTPVWCKLPENRKRKHSHIFKGWHSSIIVLDKDTVRKEICCQCHL